MTVSVLLCGYVFAREICISSKLSYKRRVQNKHLQHSQNVPRLHLRLPRLLRHSLGDSHKTEEGTEERVDFIHTREGAEFLRAMTCHRI